MMDHIAIHDLLVETHIGVEPEERSRSQLVRIQADIEMDLGSAAASDDVAHTVDYAAAVAGIDDLVRRAETRLLETLAGKIIDHLAAFDGVRRVTVEVGKEPPPVDARVRMVSVRMSRAVPERE